MMGEAIRKARTEAGLSQQELGERLRVVRQTVSKWEKGASVPDADLLVAWSGFRFATDYLAPQDQHAIYLDYEINGRKGQAQIWLDSHDQSVTNGYALDEGPLSDAVLSGIEHSTLAGFLGKPNSALMLMNAFEIAGESQGGRVTSVSAYDYEY